MKHSYEIEGMSCNGCRSRVEAALNEVPDIQAEVSLSPPLATITMQKQVSTQVLQAALSRIGHYTLKMQPPHSEGTVARKLPAHQAHPPQNPEEKITASSGGGRYYCPMHCEGDKTYDRPGSCPVCGMNLVREATADTTGTQDDEYTDLKRKFILALILTLPVFFLAMAPMVAPDIFHNLLSPRTSNWVQFILTAPIVFYCGWMFFKRAWASLKSRHLNMFTLIGLGTAAAFLFSLTGLLSGALFPEPFKGMDGAVHLYFEAVAVILTLALLGQLMEARALHRTGDAISRLLELAPVTATLVKEGEDRGIPLEDIHPGDLLKVKPGEKIPVDGLISQGDTHIDESMITGEPMPVDKSPGDTVRAGTINGHRTFLMKAERVGSDTLLARIIEMVRNASRSRAPIQRLADKIAGWFVPTVILIAVATFVIWSIWGGAQGYVYGFVNAVAVLIVACPCALGLATPLSVMVGVGKGAQWGVLIKDAAALETMSRVNMLITDKTGTLTEGTPSLKELIATGSWASEDLLKWAAAVNQHSEHPLAAAVVKAAGHTSLPVDPVQDFEAWPGKGVTGTVQGHRISMGNEMLMKDAGITITDALRQQATAYRLQGHTLSYIAVDQTLAGLLLITDAIKPSSQKALRQLEADGIEVMMLTGDNEDTARTVAGQLGIKKYKAQALPQDKLQTIQSLQATGRIVAMAGDGINDGPALAQSNVGIAMGTGNDVAIESAGITLINGDLNDIVKARHLSHAVMRNIRQNLFFAFVYNVLGVPVAAGILYPVFGILMSPMIAAAAMSFSSVSVILNALRLRHTKII